MHYRNGREAKNGDKIVKLAVAMLLPSEFFIVLFQEMIIAMVTSR